MSLKAQPTTTTALTRRHDSTGVGRRSPRLGADWRLAWLCILPLMVIVVGLIIYPFSVGIVLSFQNKLVGTPASWVGLDNFRALLVGKQYSGMFWQAVRVTLIYTLGAIAVKLVLGTLMALLLNGRFLGQTVMRSLLFIPWAVPTVVVALTWRWLYEGSDQGLFNHILKIAFGVDTPVQFLSNPHLALPAVVVVVIWQGTPFYTMMFIASLQTIPEERYEAAAIDGANAVRRFIHVTLPALRSTVMITTLLSTIWTANSINFVYILTKGGPLDATMTFPMMAYNIGLQGRQLGLSATISVLFLPLFIALIWILTRRMLNQEARD